MCKQKNGIQLGAHSINRHPTVLAPPAMDPLALRVAVRDLNDRGLYSSAQWCAELLVSHADDVASPAALPAATSAPVVDQREADRCSLALTYFAAKEFRRCHHALNGASSWLAIFLRNYALFMAGEKAKDEAQFEGKEPAGAPLTAQSLGSKAVQGLLGQGAPALTNPGHPVNRELAVVAADLAAVQRQRGSLDGYCSFLSGLVCKAQGQTAAAVAALVASVNAVPLNWSAWKTLVSLCNDMPMVNALQLAPHPMREFLSPRCCWSCTSIAPRKCSPS